MRTPTVVLGLMLTLAACASSGDGPGADGTVAPGPTSDATVTTPTGPPWPSPVPTTRESPSPAASPAASAPATPSAEPPRSGPPDTVVVNADTGELQVRDSADGDVVRVLARFDDPDEHEGPVAAGRFLDEVRRDGDRALFTTCCEPAFGEVREVAIGGGDPEHVTTGTSPTTSPGGILAVVHGQEVVVNPDTVSERRLTASAPPGRLLHLDFGPDGRLLAGAWNDAGDDGLAPTEIFVVDLAVDASLDDAARYAPAGDDLEWTAPAFRSDGTLVVAEQPAFATAEDGVDATGVVLDPRSGSELARFPLGGSVAAQRYDATGTYLLTVHQDESLDWRGAGGGGQISAGGILDAAW